MFAFKGILALVALKAKQGVQRMLQTQHASRGISRRLLGHLLFLRWMSVPGVRIRLVSHHGLTVPHLHLLVHGGEVEVPPLPPGDAV